MQDFNPILIPIRGQQPNNRPIELDFRRWPSKRFAAPAVSTYTGGDVPGVAALPASITIAGVSKTPDFRYVASAQVGATWPADGYGDNLTRNGAAGALVTDPFGESAYKFNATSPNFQGGASSGNFELRDGVVELVFKMPRVNASFPQLLGKRTASANGWEIATTDAGKLLFLPVDALVNYVLAYSGTIGADTWAHAMLFFDRSGSCQWYVNGAESGPAYVVSAIGSINPTTPLRIGRWLDTDAAQQFQGKLALAQLWSAADWLDTHLQATVAASRFALLMGRGDRESRRIYSYARGSALGRVASWFSADDLTVASDCVIAVPGKGGSWWHGYDQPRLCDGGLAVMPAEDLLLLNSATPSLCWPAASRVGASVTDYAAVGPSGVTDAGAIVESSDAGSDHKVVSPAITVTEGATYTFSAWIAPLPGSAARRLRIRINNDGVTDVDPLAGVIIDSDNVARYTAFASGWGVLELYYKLPEGDTSADVTLALLAEDEESAWAEVYNGDGASGVLIAEPQFRLGTTGWPYAETAAAAVSTLSSVYDWTRPEALTRLSRALVRMSLDFRLPQLDVALSGACHSLGPIPLLCLWEDASHWIEFSLAAQYDGEDLESGHYWGLHVNSHLTDATGEDLGAFGEPEAGGGYTGAFGPNRLLRLSIAVDGDGLASVGLVDVAAREVLVSYHGTLASWATLNVAKVRLGCDHLGGGQRHLIIEGIRVI